MVPAYTPPGTPLVVVWESNNVADYVRLCKPHYRAEAKKMFLKNMPGHEPWLRGMRLTLHAVHLDDVPICGYLVEVAERPNKLYHPSHFKVAELPKCLTDILAGVPVLEDV